MSKSRTWIENRLQTTVHAVAARRGEDPSNFAKKVKRGLSAEVVIETAKMFDADPVQALRDTGFLPGEPHKETPEQLAERIKADVDRLASKLHDTNVIPLHPKNAPDVAADFYNQETPTSFPFEEAVAKDSEDLDDWEEDDNTP